MFIAFPLAVLEFAAVVALWGATLFLLSIPVWTLLTGEVLGGLDIAAGPSCPPCRGSRRSTRLPWRSCRSSRASSCCRSLRRSRRRASWRSTGRSSPSSCAISGPRALEQRVETLEVSRKAVLDVEASELRRIERDLHDGAQQRLVMLTINLGLAADKIDTDPTAAKDLVVDARDQARLRWPRSAASSAASRRRSSWTAASCRRCRRSPGSRRCRRSCSRRCPRASALRRRGAGGLLRRRGGAGERGEALAGERTPRCTCAARGRCSSSRSGTTAGGGRVAPAGGRADGSGGPGRGARRPAGGHAPEGGPTVVRAEIPAAAQEPR